jgi:hypothetical protein
VLKVSFWRYLTLSVRESLDNFIVMHATTWFFNACAFAVFALLHRFYKFAYISIGAMCVGCVIRAWCVTATYVFCNRYLFLEKVPKMPLYSVLL